MNQALSNPIPQTDIDDSYRRASALDPSRPGEWVRRKVLAHASQLGAERAVRDHASARGARSTATQPAVTQTSPPPSRLPLFGSVAAMAVVVIFASWYFLGSRDSSGMAAPPTRPTDQAAPQIANASPPSTSKATASLPPASTERRTVAAAPRPVEPTSSAGKPKPARVSQAHQPPATTAAALNDVPDVQATSLPTTTVEPVPPPAPAIAEAVPQPIEASAPSAASASPPEPAQPASALWVAAEAGDLRGLKAALDDHVNVNSLDEQGRTALMLATVHGQARTVKALLSHGADPNIPDAHNQTPLHAAIAGGQSSIVIILKHSGAK